MAEITKTEENWEAFLEDPYLHPEEKYPFISVVIPTKNCAEDIPITLNSIFSQDYTKYEIIIIDADSEDHTKESIEGYRSDKIRLYSCSSYNLYEMLNKGIGLAQGKYINFLFPGDFYLSKYVMKMTMGFTINQLDPDLIFGACFLREKGEDLRILYRPLSHEWLKKGKQPTSLEACWFSSDLFKKTGKFRNDLVLRGSFDFFCRFLQDPHLRFSSFYRVLFDYEHRLISREKIMTHFFETGKIIRKYYGFTSWIRWLFTQKDLGRFFRHWFRKVKFAFSGKSPY